MKTQTVWYFDESKRKTEIEVHPHIVVGETG
jgi:hypothetical protein